jgi:hypothetical protein
VLYTLCAGRPPFRADNLPAMLQLQRYADPDPVRRFAPDLPTDLQRIIVQLMEKEPAARFPNTQVVARRLEAMLHALSRPVADDDFVVGDPSGRGGFGPQPAIGVPDDLALGATREAPGELGSSISLAPAPEASTPAAGADVAGWAVTPPPARYTAVDDPHEDRAAAWVSAVGPALLLLVAVAALAGGLWWWSKPLTADQLYRRVAENDERGDVDSGARGDVSEFLSRFPDDPRADEVRDWGDRLRTLALEKQLALGRLSLRARSRGIPVEELLFLRAREMAEGDPVRGAQRFVLLAELLESAPPVGDKATARQRVLYAELARREALRLSTRRLDESKRLAEFCRERLAVIREVAKRDRGEGAALAEALIAAVPRYEETATLLDEAKLISVATGDVVSPDRP